MLYQKTIDRIIMVCSETSWGAKIPFFLTLKFVMKLTWGKILYVKIP